MKVAITHPYSWPEVRRGAERITVETGRALAARGHDVTLFTAGRAPAGDGGRGRSPRVVRYRRVLEREWQRGGVLIPGGVRFDDFAPADERAPVPTILFSGALTEPRKNLDVLLEAVPLLATRVPDLQL